MNTVQEADTQTDNSLDVIQPQGVQVVINHKGEDHKFTINEFPFGDIPTVIANFVNIGVAFSSISKDQIGIAIGALTQNSESALEIIRLAVKDDLARITASEEADKQIEFIKSLSGMNGVRLVSKIVKVNYDFFDQAKEIVFQDFPQLRSMSGEQSTEKEETPEAS